MFIPPPGSLTLSTSSVPVPWGTACTLFEDACRKTLHARVGCGNMQCAHQGDSRCRGIALRRLCTSFEPVTMRLHLLICDFFFMGDGRRRDSLPFGVEEEQGHRGWEGVRRRGGMPSRALRARNG
uniref:Uncharacterized protein n=1 Tax=Morchella importuna TaxID=1174673 RepID=A0A650AG28_9PEZI|nr:hypothetical protein [Morchella importuna]QGN66708.1 hypothetical protein [Morchella importuna]